MKKAPSHNFKKFLDFIETELQASVAIAIMLALIVSSALAAPGEDGGTTVSEKLTTQETATVSATFPEAPKTDTSVSINGNSFAGINFGAKRYAGIFNINPNGYSAPIFQAENHIYPIKPSSTSTSVNLTAPFAGNATIVPLGSNTTKFKVTLNDFAVDVVNQPVTIPVKSTSKLDLTLSGQYALSAVTFNGSVPEWSRNGGAITEPEQLTEDDSTLLTEPANLQVTPLEITIEAGKSFKIIALTSNLKGQPVNGDIRYTSGNEKIATVTDGQVNAISEGTTSIAVKSGKNPNLATEVKVTVIANMKLDVALSTTKLSLGEESATMTLNLVPQNGYSDQRLVKLFATTPANVSVKFSKDQITAGQKVTATFTADGSGISEAQTYPITIVAFDGLASYSNVVNVTVEPTGTKWYDEGNEPTKPLVTKWFQDSAEAEPAKSSGSKWFLDNAELSTSLIENKTGIRLEETTLSPQVQTFVQKSTLANATQAEISQTLKEQGVTGFAAIMHTVSLNVEKAIFDISSMLGINKTVAKTATQEIQTNLDANKQAALTQVLKPADVSDTLGSKVSSAVRNITTNIVTFFRGGGAGAAETLKIGGGSDGTNE